MPRQRPQDSGRDRERSIEPPRFPTVSNHKSQFIGFLYSNPPHYIMKSFDLKLKEDDDNNFPDHPKQSLSLSPLSLSF